VDADGEADGDAAEFIGCWLYRLAPGTAVCKEPSADQRI